MRPCSTRWGTRRRSGLSDPVRRPRREASGAGPNGGTSERSTSGAASPGRLLPSEGSAKAARKSKGAVMRGGTSGGGGDQLSAGPSLLPCSLCALMRVRLLHPVYRDIASAQQQQQRYYYMLDCCGLVYPSTLGGLRYAIGTTQVPTSKTSSYP